MHQINVILDYITLLLTREPFEFEDKKSMCIKLLSGLMSLEKYHKTIITVQRWMFDVDVAEKYSRAEESNNIIFYNESLQPISSMELELRKKKAVIESKHKLLDVLEKTDLNQRLLLEKSKVETERSQLKLNRVRNALDSVLEVYNQIHTQNEVNKIKIDGIFEQMKSIEDKLEKRVTDFDLCLKELNKSIADISKKSSKSEKKLTIEQEISEDSLFCEINFLNVFAELNKIVDCSNQNMEKFQPLEPLSQNEKLLDLNLIDFHKNYNFANKILLLNMQKNCDTNSSINAVLKNLNVVEQTFDWNLKNIGIRIYNVLNERDESTLILNKLNDDLEELKKNKNSLVISNQNIDHLKTKSIEDNSNLEKKIHKANRQLTSTTGNSQQLNDNILRLDSIFHKTYQKSINEMNIEHHELFRDDNQPSKVMSLYKELDSAMNDHSELLVKRKEIMTEQFEREKNDLATTIKEHSDKVIETSNVINFYENKIPVYKQFVKQLKDLAVSKEMVKKDLLVLYRVQTLEQLNDEETEFKGYINSYNKELDEINKEDNNIEIYSKLTELNMNAQMKKLKEKLQLITDANTSLEMELKKKKYVP